MRRFAMGRRHSRRSFKRGAANIKSKNSAFPMRGGFRI